jgi:hypothetical protein
LRNVITAVQVSVTSIAGVAGRVDTAPPWQSSTLSPYPAECSVSPVHFQLARQARRGASITSRYSIERNTLPTGLFENMLRIPL